MPEQVDDRLLVGGGPDDAGVYRLEGGRVMIQSVDFFTPIVDDPAAYGTIAAVNAMSDVYAMGGRPATALNVVGVPLEEVGRERLSTILRAGARAVMDAGALLVGGHTVKNPEPVVGMAVTGFADEDDLTVNGRSEVHDRLILTKPLGTGIVTTAHTRNEVPERSLCRAVDWMERPNTVGPALAEAGRVSTMTDVTGYGLAGHLLEMLEASQGARLSLDALPLLPGVRDLIEADFVPGGTRDNWESVRDRVSLRVDDEQAPWLICDAQTSGGLLMAVPDDEREAVQTLLREAEWCHEVIGRVTGEPGIVVEP